MFDELKEKDRKSKEGSNKYLLVIILTGIIIMLAATNPTTSDFAEWTVSRAVREGLVEAEVFVSLLGEPMVRGMTIRNNYVLFSVFIFPVSETDYEPKTLGVLGNFILLNYSRKQKKPYSYEKVEVPELVGKSYQEAKDLLQDQGLRFNIYHRTHSEKVPKDHILEQFPEAGEKVEIDSLINVVISDGDKQ